jgi:hypothetical protein
MSARKQNRSVARKRPVSSDAELIRACVQCAQAAAAAHAAFIADPDGNNKYAEPASRPHFSRAEKLIGVIAEMSATTASAIAAKANLIPTIISLNGWDALAGDRDVAIEGTSVAFLRAFANDVRAFAKPIIEAEWRASRAEGGVA